MVVKRTMIDEQLAMIATVSRKARPEDNRLLKIFLVSWSRYTRKARAVRARHCVWRAIRTERLVAGAVSAWRNWMERYRDKAMGWSAQEAKTDARRHSRALHYFKELCASSRRAQHLKEAFRVMRTLTCGRPMESRWSRWRTVICDAQVKATFSAWAATAQRERRLKRTSRVLMACKKAVAVARIWKRWRRRTGASTLSRLLHAWAVIGPVRTALEVMRQLLTEMRAQQHLRRRLLRRGLRDGFNCLRNATRYVKFATSRAQEHARKRTLRQGFETFRQNVDAQGRWVRMGEQLSGKYRRRTLQKSMQRWLVRHRLVLAILIFARRLKVESLRLSVKTWARQTTLSKRVRTLGDAIKRRILISGVERLKANVARRRAKSRELAVAATKLRCSLLSRGLKCWSIRARSIKTQGHILGVGSTSFRLRSFRRGLARLQSWTLQQTRARRAIRRIALARQAAGLVWWREAVVAARTVHEARLSHETRVLSVALSCWGIRASRSRAKHDLRRAADLFFWRQSLSAVVSLWQRRIQHIVGVHSTIRTFQLHRRLRLGLQGLHRWAEKRRIARLANWRAGVWTETFHGTSALRKWRMHAHARTKIEACVRIAEDRWQAKEATRGRCFSLVRQIFDVLHRHAQTRTIERRALKAWWSRSQHVWKEARALRLRSGLRSLRLWAKSSAHWRDCRSKELRYANRMTKKAAIQAWKNTVYPLGLRVQRGPSIGSRDGEATRNARVHVATNKEGTKPWRAKECLKVTTAATAQDWTTLLGCSSLVLLRLPMIGKHMRRVLYVWRKLTKKGKRVEYIRSILPQKMSQSGPSPASPFRHPHFTGITSAPAYLEQAVKADLDNALVSPQGGRNDVGAAKAQTNRTRGCSRRRRAVGDADSLSWAGRNMEGRQGSSADYIVDSKVACPGSLVSESGSYLQLHLLSSGKRGVVTR